MCVQIYTRAELQDRLTYLRVAVSHTDCDNPSKEIEISMTGVVEQPLHMTLKKHISGITEN